MPSIPKLLGFAALIGLVATVGYMLSETSRPQVFAGETYRFGEHVPDGWTRVCVASQYEFIRGACAIGSLDEVPVGTVSIMYEFEGREGTCIHHRLPGDFLVPGHSDSRCFRAGEINGETLIRNDGVYVFGNLQLGLRD